MFIDRIFNIVELSILPKLSYRSNATLVKIPVVYFGRNREFILKYKSQGTGDSQNDLENLDVSFFLIPKFTTNYSRKNIVILV